MLRPEHGVRYHYVWFLWSTASLLPWLARYMVNATPFPGIRSTHPLFPWQPAGSCQSSAPPEFARKMLAGGAMFLGLYTVLLLGLRWFTPGYIEQVWNLAALSGVLIGGLPLEELLFGLAFGMYWAGVYEHFAWHRSVIPASRA